MIDLNVKGLVQFMAGDDAQRRRVLAAFKFPDVGKPLRTYYREAIPAIRTCVAGEITRVEMLNRADALTKEAAHASRGRRTRLNHNARAIIEYDEKFGDREFRGVRSQRLSYTQGEVKIAVHPELWVLERSQLNIFKLELTTEPLLGDALSIMAQIIYHAARQRGVDVSGRQVGIIELASGEVHVGKRIGVRLERRIAAALENIEALWPTITRSPKRPMPADDATVLM